MKQTIQSFENHNQWAAVEEVCKKLKEAGYSALLAGGCVRDLLMNREPHDFDIATNAHPEQVEKLFPKALTVGRDFGVTIVPFPGFQLEIATFREDGPYIDGRRPESVIFSTPERDASRRDFTINALFWDFEEKTVLDFVGGQQDIRAKLIRTVGEPELRFEEDKLRLLRAVRFAAQLEFTIHPETLQAIIKLAPKVNQVSRERVRDEILKLSHSAQPLIGLRLLISTGLFEVLFPEVANLFSNGTTSVEDWLHPFSVFRQGEKTDVLFLALFFYPRYQEVLALSGGAAAEKDIRENSLKALKLDNRVVETILYCYRHLPAYQEPDKVRRGEMALLLLHLASKEAEVFANLLERAKNGKNSAERQAYLAQLKSELKNISATGARPTAFLNGEDIKAAGVPAGPKMGKILNEAFLLQLEGLFKSKEEAMDWLKLNAPK